MNSSCAGMPSPQPYQRRPAVQIRPAGQSHRWCPDEFSRLRVSESVLDTSDKKGLGSMNEPTTAIVTGASRGFGRGVATALVTAGRRVVGVARTEKDLSE